MAAQTEFNLDDILDGIFESDFADGFESEMPDGYCLQEDRQSDSPWCEPWYDRNVAISDWYDPELDGFDMGKAWAEKVRGDWESYFGEQGNLLTEADEAKGDKLKIDNLTVYLPMSRAAYFHWYEGQTNPQGAYLELDPADNSLIADWNGEIGNAIPMDVNNHRRFRYGFPATTPLQTVRELMEEIAPLAARVIAGYSEDYDSNGNLVGRLNDDARNAEDELLNIINRC